MKIVDSKLLSKEKMSLSIILLPYVSIIIFVVTSSMERKIRNEESIVLYTFICVICIDTSIYSFSNLDRILFQIGDILD